MLLLLLPSVIAEQSSTTNFDLNYYMNGLGTSTTTTNYEEQTTAGELRTTNKDTTNYIEESGTHYIVRMFTTAGQIGASVLNLNITKIGEDWVVATWY